MGVAYLRAKADAAVQALAAAGEDGLAAALSYEGYSTGPTEEELVARYL